MGAISFRQRWHGATLQQAYKKAVEVAISDYGTDNYNGTISTTNGVRDVTKSFKSSGLSIDAYIADAINNHKCQKWGDAWAICVKEPKTNKNKIKSQVDHNVIKGTTKWELKYVVVEGWDENEIGAYKTKGEAVKKAREYTEKNQKTTKIFMEKRVVGSGLVATVKYKQAQNESDGEWILFGWAAH